MQATEKETEVKFEINYFDVIQIDVKANKLIKDYRKSLGLETPQNRIDNGDIKCILSVMNGMGFSIIRKQN